MRPVVGIGGNGLSHRGWSASRWRGWVAPTLAVLRRWSAWPACWPPERAV